MQSNYGGRLKAIVHLLSAPFRLAIFAGASIIVTLMLTIISGTVLLFPLELNPTAEPLRVAGMALIGIMTGLLLTSMPFLGSRPSGLLGGILGFSASACSFCAPIWVYALGLGGALGFLSDWSPAIILLSMALLLFSIWKVFDPVCMVMKNGKNVQN
ncbi:MAG: hypothetical protein ABH863_00835 [Candidatus Micrarchaeota archaeon]